MEETKIRIRTAGPDDAEQLLAIYAPYVEKTAITFEYDVPDVEEFRDRIRRILKRYPYLVAETADCQYTSVIGRSGRCFSPDICNFRSTISSAGNQAEMWAEFWQPWRRRRCLRSVAQLGGMRGESPRVGLYVLPPAIFVPCIRVRVYAIAVRAMP